MISNTLFSDNKTTRAATLSRVEAALNQHAKHGDRLCYVARSASLLASCAHHGASDNKSGGRAYTGYHDKRLAENKWFALMSLVAQRPGILRNCREVEIVRALIESDDGTKSCVASGGGIFGVYDGGFSVEEFVQHIDEMLDLPADMYTSALSYMSVIQASECIDVLPTTQTICALFATALSIVYSYVTGAGHGVGLGLPHGELAATFGMTGAELSRLQRYMLHIGGKRTLELLMDDTPATSCYGSGMERERRWSEAGEDWWVSQQGAGTRYRTPRARRKHWYRDDGTGISDRASHDGSDHSCR